MQPVRPKVLIVDDDPSHLEIYAMFVRQAGYEPLSALVRFSGPEYPSESAISLILLDYKLNSARSTVEIAEEMRSLYPAAPIVLLSDIWNLPDEMASLVQEFVRKGEPAKLMSVLRRIFASLSG